MVTVKTPEEYIQGFPHKRLPPITKTPTYKTIRPAHRYLSANAVTIKTHLGGGRHGYLTLTMPPAHYSNFLQVAFVFPVNPGLAPMYPPRATSAAIATLKAQYDKRL